MTAHHQEKPKFVINWSVFLTSIATTIVLLCGAYILQSYQNPKTARDIQELQMIQKSLDDRQNKQELFNVKMEDKMEYIVDWIKEQKAKGK